ncbi:hypothetical protein D1B31_14395 [Neobacillus notoginsengisoli]|uniref:Uncharacterized protein n=1 Tax=Neobacillus notoginsengisoli TaxID=1578198 RepID=A0A417YRE3_9BACI|nr:hypothetical protein [Neobacillus notoginsengisoli]RHW37973.1 hypothetical protein D1B31_14395 [Neobacillus notoginsengisoli]
MLEITGDDIKDLSDTDNRTLIGLLCEAELRASGIPTAGVTYGGHQNAADGGLDVRVDMLTELMPDGFIPRSKTGFQVKKPDMPRSRILDEMRPDGVLRPVIKDLLDSGGAYIIVSSQGSTADGTLSNRKEAMVEALSDSINSSDYKVDFYDRERVAGWVRSHPSLVLWVRDKIGRSVQGWRAYGNWARSHSNTNEQYIFDEHIRLHNSTSPSLEGESALNGLNEIRSILKNPGSSVRLVGLSGVGKTRFVQALFDERIGENSLNQTQVFYADMSDSPSPEPRNFAERIIAQKVPAVLVIDNCQPELHKRLTSVCTTLGSLVSLITVEYDVREDIPEETDVYHLEPASDNVIRELIVSRFPYVSRVDSRTIASFSGGNARVAIALANTIRSGENLGNLRDYDLFTRLFMQRNNDNPDLLRVAEVCSLVYSFDFTFDDTNDELRLLGSLIGMSVRDVYENIRELERRELVQKRSKWRALLPHALANKLAVLALEDIPLENILNVFEKGGNARLLKSFSRRLSYLHESAEAIEISKYWLSDNGLLGDVSNLDELGITLLKNIAPVNPELTLSAIERVTGKEIEGTFFSRDNEHFNVLTILLCSLAYDKELFSRSVKLLCLFALSERPNENYNSIRARLKPLFYIKLSGTHATPSDRLCIISNLIDSGVEEEIKLGLSLLNSALESWHFNTLNDFEFGARSRNNGYVPRKRTEIEEWFELFIDYIVSLSLSEAPYNSKAKVLLADKFRELWVQAKMHNQLEEASISLVKNSEWKEGWAAVKSTIKFNGAEMVPEVLEQLNRIEKILRPMTLLEQARLYALTQHRHSFDLIDTIDLDDEEDIDEYTKVEQYTRFLGSEVATDEQISRQLLPELLSNDGPGIFDFGEGLAHGCDNLEELWQDMLLQLSLIDEKSRKYQILRGFLRGTAQKNRDIAEQFLDTAVSHDLLSQVYPWLQMSVDICERGVKRLKLSLNNDVAPIWQYGKLAYGRAHEPISDDSFCELLRKIDLKPEGNTVAIKIMQMRLHGNNGPFSEQIISTAQNLLLNFQFERKFNGTDRMDYEMAAIIKVCFKDKVAEGEARIYCSNLLNSYKNYNNHSLNYQSVLKAIAKVQPIAFLDAFLSADELSFRIRRVFSGDFKPLNNVENNIIINWCEVNPKIRYPFAASIILPFRQHEDTGILEWTQMAHEMITRSYDPVEVLKVFSSSLKPTSWSGSRADIMRERLPLISGLKTHTNSSVVNWAAKEEHSFEQKICSVREGELKWAKERDERFE